MFRIFPSVKVLLLLISCGAALAQEFPTKPLRLMMHIAPGGPDAAVRPMAQHMSEFLGKPVVMEYRGGGGVPAVLELMNQAADGYTILFVDSSLWGILPAVRPSVPYDPIRDFAPIKPLFTSGGVLMFAPTSAPFKDVKELIVHARANPGKLRYAVVGLGGIHHLAGASFASVLGLDMQAIVYKGVSEALPAVLRGDVDFGYLGLGGIKATVAAGRLRLLAVATRTRNKFVLNVPTIMEGGALKEDFHIASQMGLVARSGTAKPILDRLSAAVARSLSQADVSAAAENTGYEILPGSAEDFAELMRDDLRRYRSMIKASGIKVE